jgi:hypothetical protein
MKLTSVSLLLLMAMLLFSCKTSKNSQDDSRLAVYTIPEKYEAYHSWLKDEILVLSNSSTTEETSQQEMLDVVVVDTSSGLTLFSQQFREGRLTWTNRHTFMVSYLPGNPEPGKSYSMLYNVKTRQRSEHNHTLQNK